MYYINKIENGLEMKLHDGLPTYDSAWGMLEVMNRFARKEHNRTELGRWQLQVQNSKKSVTYQIVSPYVA